MWGCGQLTECPVLPHQGQLHRSELLAGHKLLLELHHTVGVIAGVDGDSGKDGGLVQLCYGFWGGDIGTEGQDRGELDHVGCGQPRDAVIDNAKDNSSRVGSLLCVHV